MTTKEYCRYIRTYSELEGLQHAHTLIYCAAAVPQGVVLELRREQSGHVHSSAALMQGSFSRAMQLMRYLCENGIGQEQWLDVLADAGQPCRLLKRGEDEPDFPGIAGTNLDFCAMCQF